MKKFIFLVTAAILNVRCNLIRDPHKNRPCQVWFNLVQWFQRRRFKCDNLRHTMDAKWWQKLIWPLARWPKKPWDQEADLKCPYIPKKFIGKSVYLDFVLQGLSNEYSFQVGFAWVFFIFGEKYSKFSIIKCWSYYVTCEGRKANWNCWEVWVHI